MPASVVGAPGKRGSVFRRNWLLAEYARLEYECQYLDDLNTSIQQQIERGSEMEAREPSKRCCTDITDATVQDEITSLDQVQLESVQEEDKQEASLRPSLTREGGRIIPNNWDRKDSIDTSTAAEKDDGDIRGSISTSSFRARRMMRSMGTYSNTVVMTGSALGKSRPVEIMIYLLAFCGVVFVLLATATHLGVHHEEGGHVSGDHALEAAAGVHGHHRRLGGAAPPLLKNIAFSLVGAGLVSFFLNILGQPLILGYLLGGVLVGPLCLGIVTGHSEIAVISKLGLLFLLFMVGMEVDFHRLWRMDRIALVVGFLHVPIIAVTMYAILSFLTELTGFRLGGGGFATLYISFTCAISSSIIVKKMLAEQFQADLPAGRLTHGIRVCQDIWAIIMLACQPTISDLAILHVVRNFAMIIVLLIVAFAYAKFVMPPVLHSAGQSVELKLVLSLSWCFFICSAAILPFVSLSMELAALIAGTALATFPYSQDMNGKIKYIRDFFIPLFFAGVGMQVPVPNVVTLAKAVLLVVLVLAIRWLGICTLVVAAGGSLRQGALATINLSQLSELALVISSMGLSYGFDHIEEDTMSVLIWAFGILAVLSTFALSYSSRIVRAMASIGKRVMTLKRGTEDCQEPAEVDDDPEVLLEGHTDIILLGFHRIASMLIADFQIHNPEMLKRIHVIDMEEASLSTLREKGIRCSWGDFASAKELARCHKGEATLVLSTIPDSLMQGVTNMKLLKVAKSVWPGVLFIATADSPYQAETLYKEGADYVVRMAKLCAERLHHLLSEHCKKALGSCELNELFKQYKGKDRDARTRKGFLSLNV